VKSTGRDGISKLNEESPEILGTFAICPLNEGNDVCELAVVSGDCGIHRCLQRSVRRSGILNEIKLPLVHHHSCTANRIRRRTRATDERQKDDTKAQHDQDLTRSRRTFVIKHEDLFV